MQVFRSEALTDGVRVAVESHFDAERSNTALGKWFFLYTITISNEGEETVQLLRRHWRITDGRGKTEEVRGDGVVGETPVLKPGEKFRYTSGCPLDTPDGVMHGNYEMVDEEGRFFDVTVAPFTLAEEMVLH